MLNMQESVEFGQQLGSEIAALVCQNLSWHTDASKEFDQLLGDAPYLDQLQSNSLGVPCRIIANDKNVFFPERLHSNGMVSIAIQLNGSSIIGRGMTGAGGARLEQVFWHSEHDLQ